MKKLVPKIIQEVGFDFSWDEKKVWQLNFPAEDMDINELTWHFAIPFLWEGNDIYNLKPQDVIDFPDKHQEEYARTMSADLAYPIDIMKNKGRWLILDGLHRLMKAQILKLKSVKVRKIPRSSVPEIVKD